MIIYVRNKHANTNFPGFSSVYSYFNLTIFVAMYCTSFFASFSELIAKLEKYKGKEDEGSSDESDDNG